MLRFHNDQKSFLSQRKREKDLNKYSSGNKEGGNGGQNKPFEPSQSWLKQDRCLSVCVATSLDQPAGSQPACFCSGTYTHVLHTCDITISGGRCRNVCSSWSRS